MGFHHVRFLTGTREQKMSCSYIEAYKRDT